MTVAAARVYLASDVHWRPERPGEAPPLGAFGRFLGDLGERARAVGPIDLYVLGDLFEYWFERDGKGFPFYESHVSALAAARDAGVRLTLLFGNRDFTYRGVLHERAGAHVAGDRAVVEIGGRRVLLEHGDLLCTRDWRYQVFRRVIRSTPLRLIAGLLSLERMTRLIGSLRRASQAEIERKAPSALEVVDAAVARRLDEGFDVVVCGHVHRPARRPVRAGSRTGELVTLGAWEDDGGWYVAGDEGGLHLERYAG
jgi:UDP-2,3-diacylglucosamine hydrolase